MRVTLADGRSVGLGRVRPKSRPPTLRFGSYFSAMTATTPPPASVDYAAKAMDSISRVYENDVWGCCVISGKYHSVGVWSGNESGTPAVGTDQEVLNSYHTICGPGDNGCVITNVLDYARTNGLPFNGVVHKIDGYVSVDWRDATQVKVALYLFGTLSVGINLPQAWTQGGVWDLTNTRIVGGHDVTAVGYNPTGVVIATWGGLRTITWAAFQSTRWVEELYLPLSPDWYGKKNLAPSGFDASALKADLAKLGGGILPPIDPTPVVPPPTPTPDPPVPVPVPVPPIPPPAPVGLTLSETIAVADKAVWGGGLFSNSPARTSARVTVALTKAWPKPK